MTSISLGILLDTQEHYRFDKHISIRLLQDELNKLYTDFNFQGLIVTDNHYVTLPFIYKGEDWKLIYNYYYASMELSKVVKRKLNETRN